METKTNKKKITMFILFFLFGILLMITVLEFIEWTSFPGKIHDTNYKATTEGIKSTFHKGVIYRYPKIGPLLSVSGSHYEMGLQYGVLLQPEINKALKVYKNILRWEAKKRRIPFPILIAFLKYKAKKLARKLPDRFLKELKGVADGSGVPQDVILTVSLLYDVGISMGCTSLLMKGKKGAIIHGRNNDWFESGGLGNLTVVVRHNATGYHSVTHTDFPLWMGVETGFNNKGLTFSEETYGIKKPNANGFPIVYLARIALETCSNLDEITHLVDRYPVIAGYGTVWSDRDNGEGMLVELTPDAKAIRKMDGSILWNFNHIYDHKLHKQQRVQVDLDGWNLDRETLACCFPVKPEYDVKDAVKFLRSQKTADGTDYAWRGTRTAICNDCGLQMIIFDPKGDGLYLAVGASYAACQKVYHIHDDFSQPPELFLEAIPIKPVIKEAAKIKNMLVSKEEKLQSYVNLAQKHKQDANAQFLVAYQSFLQSRWNLFAEYADKAYFMQPFVPEYKLFAGIAAFQKNQSDKSLKLLESINPSELRPLQKIYRLIILERAWGSVDNNKSSQYGTQRENILNKYEIKSYYQKEIGPLFAKINLKVREK